MASGGSSVDIVAAIVSSRARLELSVALVRERTVTRHGEAICRASADITLELGGRRSEDTSSSIAISDATIGIDTVLCTRQT